ncbi:MAG: YhjD/YihY/BrkB family envelope integrity protein [Labedaea sp.]
MGADEADGRRESRLARLRKRPWVVHLVRAGGGYMDRHGDHYAAAIAYFSVLSLVPIAMIAFAVTAFVLAGNQALLDQLQHSITEAVPAGFGETLNKAIDEAIDNRGAVGVLGLLAAAYSGFGWMSSLRDALSVMWDHAIPDRPYWRTVVSDLLALFALFLALGISIGITAAGTGLGSWVLRLVGLDDDAWALFLLRVGTIVLGIVANWLVFLWVLSRLPRQKVHVRSCVRGALFLAVAFEILKQVATIYLAIVATTKTGALFGPIIGLLLFANLVARLLLFATAWTAMTEERVAPIAAPPPAVIRPAIAVHTGPKVRDGALLVGAGVLAGVLWDRIRRRT